MVTNFTTGVTNTTKESPFGEFPAIDPTIVYGQHLDFFEYSNDQWITTTVGSGLINPSDVPGGVLTIINSSADNDSVFNQWEGRGGATNSVSEQYQLVAGKKAVQKTRFSLSDPIQSDCIVGLYVTNTAPIASPPTDGIYFLKSDGANTVDLVLRKSSSTTTNSAIAALSSNTYIELAFYYDGDSKVKYYVNGVQKGSSDVTNLPTTELAISFGIQNGEASAKGMNIDYITTFVER